MNNKEICEVLLQIRPGAEWRLSGDSFAGLEWLDKTHTKPTEAEIEQGWLNYQATRNKQIAEAKAKREALLDRLGITDDEAKLLLA